MESEFFFDGDRYIVQIKPELSTQGEINTRRVLLWQHYSNSHCGKLCAEGTICLPSHEWTVAKIMPWPVQNMIIEDICKCTMQIELSRIHDDNNTGDTLSGVMKMVWHRFPPYTPQISVSWKTA